MKARICIVLFVITYWTSVLAQDFHFSQFYLSPLTQNPALAGINYDFEALTSYKDQWRSVTTPFKTFGASLDARINKKKYRDSFWAAGLDVLSDRAGDSKIGVTQVNLTGAYHLKVAKYQTLGIGLQGGYAQRSINYSALQWANQYDPEKGYNPDLPSGEPESLTSFSYGDAGAGIVWSYNNTAGLIHVEDNHDLTTNIGIAVYHAKQKYSYYRISDEKLYPKYVFHGNALISLPNFHNIALVPAVVVYRQGPAQEILLGTMVRIKLRQESKYTGLKKSVALNLGGYCRLKDAVIASFLLEYSSYALGMSWDLNASNLTKASYGRGGAEITLRYYASNQYQKTLRTSVPKR